MLVFNFHYNSQSGSTNRGIINCLRAVNQVISILGFPVELKHIYSVLLLIVKKISVLLLYLFSSTNVY